MKRRIVFAEGEDERVLRAAQAILEETSEQPILIGRPSVLEQRCERLGLVVRPGRDFEIVNPEDDPAIETIGRVITKKCVDAVLRQI